LVGEGVRVTDDYLSLVMDGTFHAVKKNFDDDSDTNDGTGKNHEYMSELPYRRDDRGPA